MEIFKEIKPLKAYLREKRIQQQSIGLVPTMGALHQGHIALVKACKAENDIAVSSIYVNPTQFNNPQDLEKYPKTPQHDIDLLSAAGCDVLFAPDNQQMYQRESNIRFDFGDLDKILEGKFRPGHFSGVALVVSKFFNIVQPHIAYFGQKDFQQVMVISRLVEELKFDLAIRCMPTIREHDGLAMSSRNMRLNPEERKQAIVLYESLAMASQLLKQGESIASVRNKVKNKCEAITGISLEYFEMADAENLNLTENVSGKNVLLIAAYVGQVRLIDNLLINE